jgi:hypothetical protein
MRPALAALAAAAVLAGCGGEAGDLMAIEVSGGAAGAKRTIVITGDGRGSCNDSERENVDSDDLVEARDVERDIEELADDSRQFPERAGRRRYVVRTDDGVVRWSEGTTGLPDVLPRTALLALKLERALCG